MNRFEPHAFNFLNRVHKILGCRSSKCNQKQEFKSQNIDLDVNIEFNRTTFVFAKAGTHKSSAQ